MKLIAVRNKQTEAVSHVSEEWLERWPEDFDRVEPTDSPVENPTPATGTNKKEQSK